MKKFRDFSADFIVALGGGSTIDTAKAIAMGSVSECDPWEFFLTQTQK